MSFLSVRLDGRADYQLKNCKFLRKNLSKGKNKTLKSDGLDDAIGKACEALFYVSEIDAEILPFFGGMAAGGTRESLIHVLGLKKNDVVFEQTLDEFFLRLTKVQDWYKQVEVEKVNRFLKLQKLLEDNLKDITVVRIGHIRIDIYAVGIDESGKLAGIRTKAVET